MYCMKPENDQFSNQVKRMMWTEGQSDFYQCYGNCSKRLFLICFLFIYSIYMAVWFKQCCSGWYTINQNTTLAITSKKQETIINCQSGSTNLLCFSRQELQSSWLKSPRIRFLLSFLWNSKSNDVMYEMTIPITAFCIKSRWSNSSSRPIPSNQHYLDPSLEGGREVLLTSCLLFITPWVNPERYLCWWYCKSPTAQRGARMDALSPSWAHQRSLCNQMHLSNISQAGSRLEEICSSWIALNK